MKKPVICTIFLGLIYGGPLLAEGDSAAANMLVSNGGLESLRGASGLNEQWQADDFKRVPKDRAPLDRSYVHQPPLIPHTIRNYQVDTQSNKCLSCHGWKYAGEAGATKISATHFASREGVTLSDVSPRQYFCLQCHVVQADAKPLLKNDFAPVDSLSVK